MNRKQKAIEKFKNDKLSINVQTEDEWTELMEFLEENSDLTWSLGRKPTLANYFYDHQDKTIVTLSNMSTRLVYGFISCGEKLITFQDFKKLYHDEFKVGDKVRLKSALHNEFMEASSIENEGIRLVGWGGIFKKYLFELFKPFTQQDLEVGMLCESYSLFSEVNIINIDNLRKHKDVIKIYKPTNTGFELIWTRPDEPLFTLQCPLSDFYFRKDTAFWEHPNQFKAHIGKGAEHTNTTTTGKSAYYFTQDEIDKLPNQKLIKALLQKKQK